MLEGVKNLVIHAECFKALFKIGVLPIPLKHLHTLRVKFCWFGGLDDDLREAIHAAELQGWSMTTDNDGQIFKSCSEHVGTTPNSKLIPEKRWDRHRLSRHPDLMQNIENSKN